MTSTIIKKKQSQFNLRDNTTTLFLILLTVFDTHRTLHIYFQVSQLVLDDIF